MIAALKSLTSKAEVHVTKLGAMKRDQLVGLMGHTQVRFSYIFWIKGFSYDFPVP